MKISLNLLPEEQKKKLEKKKIFLLILQQESYAFFLMLIVIVVVVNIDMVLGMRLQSIEQTQTVEESNSAYQELQQYEDLFAVTNKEIVHIANIQKQHTYFTRIFFSLSNALRDGVTITQFTSDGDAITLSGNAATRDNLLYFKEAVKTTRRGDVKCFDAVTLPSDDIFAKEDIDFVLTFMPTGACP